MTLSKRFMIAAAFLLGAALLATEAQADEAVCGGAAPAAGQVLKGPVLQVIDGERLCVATDVSPHHWVEVRVAQAPMTRTSSADDPRGRMMAAAFGKDAVCIVTGKSGRAADAVCQVEGESLSARLERPDVIKTAGAWR